MVEVTQADREAAFAYWLYTHSLHQSDYRAVRAKAQFERGDRDEKEIVQAFARHRLAEREAVVKWLRVLGIMRAMQNPSQLADAIEAGEPFK